MEVAATIRDGRQSLPVAVQAREGLIRVIGPYDRRGGHSFQGQPEQTWRDRLINRWRLSTASSKPLRCAFKQVYLDQSGDSERLIIDPAWGGEPLAIETAGMGRSILAEWTKGKLKWLRGEKVRCTADSHGFSNVDTEADAVIATVSWNDVKAIRTYKRDLFCYDMICLAFQLADKSWIELWEESDGFLEVGQAMRRVFPDVPDKWYQDVMLPAFATNETLLHRCSCEWGECPE